MKITIRQIAEQLNLSIAAVSRALDGYPDISPLTRQRVLDAAREMGYVPNRAARQLRRQKTDAIGYILPSGTPGFSEAFFAEFLIGLGDQAPRHNLDLLVSTAGSSPVREQDLYRTWVRSQKVDGFILNRIRLNDWRVRYLAENQIPFVALERSLDGIEYPHIEVDNIGGVVSLVNHLHEQGFRRMAFIGGPEDLKIQVARLAGYRQGLADCGMVFDPELVVEGDLSASGGYQAARRLRWLPNPPEAMVCLNDETAFGVLHAMHDLGLEIGRDVAVAGFDGVAASAHTRPALTTLDIPVAEIAQNLVQMLAQLLENKPLEENRPALHPRLLVRASTSSH
ncbi:MAG: LacI family transcriptional regulator [Anaerolineae bacterium]|nr:LacI family transcriptional regulator [Anaerolineae bacterium]